MTGKEAQGLLDGSYYKIGIHGKPFRHSGVEWVLSNKTAAEVKQAIARQGRREHPDDKN